MTRGWLSIALATALGACIGTLAALEISARFKYGSYFWGFGALLGGIVAYVAVDFRHFCAGVHRSYRNTITWRPDPLYWGTLFVSFGGIAVMYNSLVGMGGAVAFYFSDYGNKLATVYFTLGIAVGVTLLAFLLGWTMTSDANGTENRTERLQNARDFGWQMMRYGNPIGMLYWSFIGLAWFTVRIPSAFSRGAVAFGLSISQTARSLAQFVAGVFIYVHSQRRTICFVDATLGAAIGYSFGSAIIGTIAGVVLGVINYELVSVRWLKLAPASR